MLSVYSSSVPILSVPFGLWVRLLLCCRIPKRSAQGGASSSETSLINPYNCYPESTAAVVCVWFALLISLQNSKTTVL